MRGSVLPEIETQPFQVCVMVDVELVIIEINFVKRIMPFFAIGPLLLIIPGSLYFDDLLRLFNLELKVHEVNGALLNIQEPVFVILMVVEVVIAQLQHQALLALELLPHQMMTDDLLLIGPGPIQMLYRRLAELHVLIQAEFTIS